MSSKFSQITLTGALLTLGLPTIGASAVSEMGQHQLAYVSGQEKQRQLRTIPGLGNRWNNAILELDIETVREIEKQYNWPPRKASDLPIMRQRRIKNRTDRGQMKTVEEKWVFLRQNPQIQRDYIQYVLNENWEQLRELEHTHGLRPVPKPSLQDHKRLLQDAISNQQPSSRPSPSQKDLRPITDVDYIRDNFNDSQVVKILIEIAQVGGSSKAAAEVLQQHGFSAPSNAIIQSLYDLGLAFAAATWAETNLSTSEQNKLKLVISTRNISEIKAIFDNRGLDPRAVDALARLSVLSSFETSLQSGLEKDAKAFEAALNASNPKKSLKAYFKGNYGLDLSDADIELYLIFRQLSTPAASSGTTAEVTKTPPLTLDAVSKIFSSQKQEQVFAALSQDNLSGLNDILRTISIAPLSATQYATVKQFFEGMEGAKMIQSHIDIKGDAGLERMLNSALEPQGTPTQTLVRHLQDAYGLPPERATATAQNLVMMKWIASLEKDQKPGLWVYQSVKNDDSQAFLAHVNNMTSVRLSPAEVKIWFLYMKFRMSAAQN